MSLVYLLSALLLIMILLLFTLTNHKLQQYVGQFVLIAPIISSIYFLWQIPRVMQGHFVTVKIPWLTLLDINIDFRVDGLSLFFSLLISLIGLAVFYYATQYLSKAHDNLPRFYIYLLLFMFSMIGVVTSNNTILMYVFWELTSVSSFLLIAYWYNKGESQFGAIQSFMITVFGGLALLAGFIMIYIVTGTNSISEIMGQSDKIAQSNLFIPIIIMILLGAFTKSAQFPFHIWLPKAMAAPTPVSAYLHSATMVKAGIFLLFRFTPMLGLSDFYIYCVTFVGLITMIFGAINATRQFDLKGILAYSTISQLGMIVSMVGLGGGFAQHPSGEASKVYGLILFAALFHLMNHALYKGALFMGVGIIDHETGTRDIRRLSGLRKVFPITHIVMLLSALSMAGIPFLNGFLSKEMFFESLVSTNELPQFNMILTIIITVIGVVASIFTLIYAVYMIKEVFWGDPQQADLPLKSPHEPFLFTLPSAIMMILLPVIFFIPNLFGESIILPALRSITIGENVDELAPHISQWHGFNLPLMLSVIVIIVGFIAALKIDWKKYANHIKVKSITEIYLGSYKHFEHYSGYSIRALMNNRLNHYITLTLLIFIMIVTYGIIEAGFPEVHQIHVSEFGPLEVITLIVVFVLGIALTFIRQRLTMVILNGIIGYCVTIFFILMKAPDLALTQLVVETITTILFIVSFSRLPNVPRTKVHKKREAVKIVVSLMMAVIVVTLVFIAQQSDSMPTISTFYHDAYKLTGGKNIVNAILGDFRALDTLFEGLVLIIAGLGIYTLLNFKDRRGQDERE
ncbi:cation:proton antiporter [Staphylococcus succinus]|nr:cation:proton antiporter [Staphylococcus succinus]